MSSNNNDDPFAKLLNQHKEQQSKTDNSSNINNSERQNNNNYNNRSRGRGRGRGRGGHFNRGGGHHHHQGRGGFKRPREEDAEEIRSKYLSRIKLDTPEDIAKWIADRKKNFPGRINNEEENGRLNNPLGLIQDYSSSEESEIEEEIEKSVEAVNDSSINMQVKNTSDSKGGDNQIEINNIEEINSNNLKINETINDSKNKNIESENNNKNNDEEGEDEELDEAPEFQTSQQTFQPSTSTINQSDKTIENAVEDTTTPVCKYFSNGQRCFKGQKCPYLHIKSERPTKSGPNHKPQQSQYKRKDLINLLQAQDIEKDSEIILQSLRYLFNNGYLN